MEPVFLSDIELYYTDPDKIHGDKIYIVGEECKHILKVMRHKKGDLIYATDGIGNLFYCEITDPGKEEILAKILKKLYYKNEFPHVVFLIPVLKKQYRLELAIEKSVELGITNFLVYPAERSITKKVKEDRLNKIARTAMKQSLRTYLPKIHYTTSLKFNNPENSTILVFDQKAKLSLEEYLISEDNSVRSRKNCFFIFGPEGGLTENEINLLGDPVILRLTKNRLRAETAVISAASMLALSIEST